MKHALFLPLFGELADPGVVVRIAAEAEEHGWDGVFVWDHLRYLEPVTDVADPWVTLAGVAAVTERLRLGPMVTPLPRRRPAKVARETASLDRLSGGRLTFGAGIGGDNARELSGTGENTDARARGAMLDEQLEILAAAWTGQPVHHRGEHYTIDDVAFRPVPVQQPRIPVWIAVKYGNTKPLARAARWDGVFPVNLDRPDQLAEIVAAVDAQRENPDAPYDVAIGGPPGADPAPFAAVGANWWLIDVDWQNPKADEVFGIVRDGPPA